MTQIHTPRETSRQPPTPPAEPDAPVQRGPSVGRLVGVDLARALAVFGMFAVHVGPARQVGGPGGWLLGLTAGRSSILFATLAGFSLMLIAGRREPKTGLAGRQAKARIVIRAVMLLALGTVLTMLKTGIVVILAFYGVYFLLALPLLRLRAKTLAIIAAVLAVVAPQANFGLRQLLSDSIVKSIDAYDPITRLGGDGIVNLLSNGSYPAFTWMPFVVAGMALARLDLVAGAVQRRLALLGAALITLGYGTSWLAFKLIPALREAADAVNAPLATGSLDSLPDPDPGSAKGALEAGSLDSLPDSDLGSAKADALLNQWTEKADEPPALVALMSSDAHTGSTFEILGGLGVAIIVLVLATVGMARLPWLRRLASPLVAVGTMSLTVYVAHVAVYALLPEEPDTTFVTLLGFIAGAILFAVIWSRFFRRGPLEYLLNSTTKLAKLVR